MELNPVRAAMVKAKPPLERAGKKIEEALGRIPQRQKPGRKRGISSNKHGAPPIRTTVVPN